MESAKRVHDSLRQVLQRQRLVFWYDPERHWEGAFDTFAAEGINKLKVVGTEFGTKVRIHRDPDPQARYLLYFPSERPGDPDNWLLDLLLQGHEYKADRASLALQEVGLPYDFRHVVVEHIGFFGSSKRQQALREMVTTDEDAASLRLKMMAVLTGATADIDALLFGFLNKPDGEMLLDPVQECFSAANLVDKFWQNVSLVFGYRSHQPSLRDFVTILFRWANPLDAGMPLDPHAKVFMQRWKDSQAHSRSFRSWATLLETDLNVADQLDALEDIRKVEASDTFVAFEKFILHRLCRAFEKGGNDSTLLATIQSRRSSFWFNDHADGYEALTQAISLRHLIASAELKVESVDAGISRYVSTWYRIDTAYRRFQYHLRRYGQVALMEKIAEWVEKTYVNNFLLILADRWCDQVRRLQHWQCGQIPMQNQFFLRYVQPFLDKGQKVYVVISDALRYETADEFAAQLRLESRWTAELEAMLGVLPSYTQLGMAALLPGTVLNIQLPDGSVMVDGKSASGTPARGQILAAALAGKAAAVQAEEFLEMNTKTEARALISDNDVVYIFHNTIDKVGDSSATEAKTTAAVETAYIELHQILRKIANANGSNMLLTSDHGFLFQQSAVDESDDLPIPYAAEWLLRNRRFALGRGITSDTTVKVFKASELGFPGDWSAAFPLALGRFPLKGSGKRYVHGGLSLQEVIIPVLRIHKGRSDDTERVEVEILRMPAKITTGQLSLALYQDRPAAEKVLPRTIQVGVFAPGGKALSEVRTVVFDSQAIEPRQREQSLILTLARVADDYNNQDVEIRLEETVPGTNQKAVYKTLKIKLQKPYASDFDEF